MRIPLTRYWRVCARYVRPEWPRVLLLATLLLSGLAIQLLNPQLLGAFIDSARAGASENLLLRTAALFFVAALIQQFLLVGATFVSESVAWSTTNALRRDLTAHCMDLDMGFHHARTPGELIERIDGDANLLANFFSQLVIQVMSSSILIVGVIGLLYRIDWRIGTVLTIFSLAVVAGMNRLRGIATPYWMAGRQASAEFAGFLEERLAGVEDIRTSRAIDYVFHHFYRLMRTTVQSYLQAHMKGSLNAGTAQLGFAIGTAIGLGLGGLLYRDGVITLGSVFLTSYYTGILATPLSTITDQLSDLQQASAGLGRIEEILGIRSATRDGPGVRMAAGAPPIELEHVWFAYHPGEPVLKHVSLSVPAGEVLALLGRTGSGKSTVGRLVFRLYDPQRGRITLDGRDLRDFTLADLRSRIALVTQDVQLFHGTVRDNLSLFDRAVADRQLEQAIMTLGLGEWLSRLPRGLDTVLASHADLSAGEAQILALTRAFLRDPDIVVLDEASSRLDPVTERLVHDGLATLLRGRTTIIIAHRLRTVEQADRIAILEDGRVVEQGTRQALAADGATRYATLLRAAVDLV
jgi:ATP-binding cassette subfamily B protein